MTTMTVKEQTRRPQQRQRRKHPGASMQGRRHPGQGIASGKMEKVVEEEEEEEHHSHSLA